MCKLAMLAAGLAASLAACAEPTSGRQAVAGADVERGRAVIQRVGCQACHVVPGVRGPSGSVGPNLDGFGGRSLISGVAANRPANLTIFLQNAPAFVPNGGMPAMPLTEQEARDAAAYLYTLR